MYKSKKHWTQTLAGKRKMRAIAKARYEKNHGLFISTKSASVAIANDTESRPDYYLAGFVFGFQEATRLLKKEDLNK